MQRALCKTVERRAIRMRQMMDRLQVDARALIRSSHGDAYAEARSKCFQCEDSSLCLLWLDKGGPDVLPDFCPNLAFFSAHKIRLLQAVPARRGFHRAWWRKARARGRI